MSSGASSLVKPNWRLWDAFHIDHPPKTKKNKEGGKRI
jgi:hypothetical protein